MHPQRGLPAEGNTVGSAPCWSASWPTNVRHGAAPDREIARVNQVISAFRDVQAAVVQSESERLAGVYRAFLDGHEACDARHGITGDVPHAGEATVTFSCRGCGGDAQWTGAAEASRRLLEAATVRLAVGSVHYGSWHITHARPLLGRQQPGNVSAWREEGGRRCYGSDASS